MKKTVISFGLIAGFLIAIMWFATSFIWIDENGKWDMSSGQLLGYINMLVGLSMIFIGIKQYRDRHLEGKITFGRAFKTGFYITLIASAIYVTGWMIFFNTSEVALSFTDQYIEHVSEKWAAANMPEAELNSKVEELRGQMEDYKNSPLMMIAWTFMEIFPVGLLISLISALILKRKN